MKIEKLNLKKLKVGCLKRYGKHIQLFVILKDGIIVLGIKEEQKHKKYLIQGVENEQKILKDFWNSINNKEKVSFNAIDDDNVKILEIDSKTIIVIDIPRANRRNKPIFINNNPLTGTYKRYNDGDFKCAEYEVRAMLIDSSEKSKDSVILEEFNIDNINMDTLKNYRRAFEIHKGDDHKWNFVSDEEFLYLINAMDRKTKTYYINV